MKLADYQCIMRFIAKALVLERLIISMLPNINCQLTRYQSDCQRVSYCSTPFHL